MKKKNKKKNVKWFSQRNLLILLFIAFLIKASWETYVTMKLKSEGIVTNAVVVDKSKFRRSRKVYYEFVLNNQRYDGISTSWDDYDRYNVGDSIPIVYISTKPNINDSKDRID